MLCTKTFPYTTLKLGEATFKIFLSCLLSILLNNTKLKACWQFYGYFLRLVHPLWKLVWCLLILDNKETYLVLEIHWSNYTKIQSKKKKKKKKEKKIRQKILQKTLFFLMVLARISGIQRSEAATVGLL